MKRLVRKASGLAMVFLYALLVYVICLNLGAVSRNATEVNVKTTDTDGILEVTEESESENLFQMRNLTTGVGMVKKPVKQFEVTICDTELELVGVTELYDEPAELEATVEPSVQEIMDSPQVSETEALPIEEAPVLEEVDAGESLMKPVVPASEADDVFEPNTEIADEAGVFEYATGSDEYIDLDWVKAHLLDYYTEEEILTTTLVVQGEDEMAHSKTVWSAHVWVVLGRVGTTGFEQNYSIMGILSARNQFDAYCASCLSAEPNPDIRWVVEDVFARKILEDMGRPPEEVGRTMPATHLFFKAGGGRYNIFYRYCWGDSYDPFDAPFNPYDD